MVNSSFIIYDASAGSGKTFTLVRNYISRLLLTPQITSYRNILAITFTNKAVAEMKSRIIESLKAFAQPEIPEDALSLFEAIQQETQLPPEEIQEKSARILKSILHNYAGFEVSTIDSFTHRILRTFAKDLNIPLNFEVYLETKEILEEAVDKVLAKAGKEGQEDLTQTLINFSLSKADDDRSWKITHDLRAIAGLLINDNNNLYLQELQEKNFSLKDFSEFKNDLAKKRKETFLFRQKKAREMLDFLAAKGLEFEDFSRKAIPVHFEKITQDAATKPSTAAWAKDIYEATIYNKGLADSKKALIDSLRSDIGDFYEQVTDAYYLHELIEKIWRQNDSLSLLTAIQKEVEKIKEERNILLISDFNKKIAASIKDEPAPFIYERLGDRYHTYYIDEFQDTSVLQWKNLIPLVADSLASETGQLTLVGDSKQSIYRWRGGKAEQFMALNADENPFYVDKHLERLPNNYRSFEQIIQFNNDFFKHIAEHFITYDLYRDLFQKAAQNPVKKEKGYVSIEFIEAENKAEEHEIYPEKVLEIIQNLHAQGHPYKDICILVRKNSEGVTIADYLAEHNIPLISSETLLLEKSKKIQFLISLLSFTLNPSDKNLKFEMLSFLHTHSHSAETTFEFIYPKLTQDAENFFKTLQAYAIDFDLHKFNALPFYDAIEYCLRSFHLLDQPDAYLQFFLDFAYEYSKNNSAGMSGFLDLWELKKDKLSITIPEGGEAVQIMTIHKSKGLEFPVVIYPYANEQIDDTSRDSLWLNLDENQFKIPLTYISVSNNFMFYGENIAEEYEELMIQKQLDALNLFYVTLTRAKAQLYILSKYDLIKGLEKTNYFSGLLIHYLKSINLWNDQTLQYNFGEIPAAQPGNMQSTEAEYLEKFISSAPENHSIEIVTGTGMLWGSEQEKAIAEGKLIHALLQNIYLESDLQKVLEEAVINGDLLAEEYPVYFEKIKKIIEHPKLKPFFQPDFEIFTEKEILVNGQYKRLDRLCLQNTKAHIIDYKTGNFDPAHESQIREYAGALERIGFEVSDKILVYISEQIHIRKVF